MHNVLLAGCTWIKKGENSNVNANAINSVVSIWAVSVMEIEAKLSVDTFRMGSNNLSSSKST